MRKIETEVFQYAELSDAAKEKARDWYRQASADDSFWSESSLECIAEAGALLGITFDVPRGRQSGKAIWFSGFWSQGDGCSYDGTWHASDCKAATILSDYTGDGRSNVELRRIAEGLAAIVAKYPESYARCSSSHRGHSLSVDTDPGYLPSDIGDGDDDDKAEAWERDFPAGDLAELLRDFASWGYRLLESEYEYQNSDECVAETIIANEYEFTAEGELF